MKNPCKNCKSREIGCHSKCVKYKEWRQKWDENAARIRKAKDDEIKFVSYKINSIKNSKK